MPPRAHRPLVRLALVAAIALLTAACTTPLQRAQNQAEWQRLNTPVEIQITEPPFDEAMAKQALAKGNTTIKGVLYHLLVSSGKHAGQDGFLNLGQPALIPNALVVLFPATAQLEHMVKLMNENRDARRGGRKVQLKNYYADPRLQKYKLSTKTDGNGLFQFTEMRPGRYMIAVEDLTVTSHGSEKQFDGVSYQPTGAMVSPYGVEPIYSQVIHSSTRNFEVQTLLAYEHFVEVPPNKKVFEVDARMRPK